MKRFISIFAAVLAIALFGPVACTKSPEKPKTGGQMPSDSTCVGRDCSLAPVAPPADQ
jgi:hypothetical protein